MVQRAVWVVYILKFIPSLPASEPKGNLRVCCFFQLRERRYFAITAYLLEDGEKDK